MSLLDILIFPDPVLKTVCNPVSMVTDEIRVLLDDMVETMQAADGVGLAAPQIGKTIRACIVRGGIHLDVIKMINPVIVSREGETTYEEGCLSIPEFLYEMKRNKKVTVEYVDENGEKKTRVAEDLLAIIIQHEIDHLDGKLLIDNISRLKQQLYLKKLKKMQQEKETHIL